MSAACIKCFYCDKDEAMDAIGIEVAKLSVSTMYLFREQSHPGRVIVAYDQHVSELVDLRADQRDAFFSDGRPERKRALPTRSKHRVKPRGRALGRNYMSRYGTTTIPDL